MNKAIIIGRLGADPELKKVGNNGTSVCRLSVATTETWTDKNGQRQEKTEWHRVVVWGRTADNCAKHLAKGRQVAVTGKIETRSWTDTNDVKRYATEIRAEVVEFLGSGKKSGDGLQDLDGGADDDSDEFQDFRDEDDGSGIDF